MRVYYAAYDGDRNRTQLIVATVNNGRQLRPRRDLKSVGEGVRREGKEKTIFYIVYL